MNAILFPVSFTKFPEFISHHISFIKSLSKFAAHIRNRIAFYKFWFTRCMVVNYIIQKGACKPRCVVYIIKYSRDMEGCRGHILNESIVIEVLVTSIDNSSWFGQRHMLFGCSSNKIMKVAQNTFTIKWLGKTTRFRYKYNIQQSWVVILMASWRYNQILEIINVTKVFMTSLFRGQQSISPIKVKSSLYKNSLSAISLICDKNVGCDAWGCLYIDDINYFDTPLLISKQMDSMPKQLLQT